MNKLESIKKGCNLLDNIFDNIINNFNFKTEKELANFIRKKARQHKLKLAFPVIVAAGKNTSNIHHKPQNKKLKGFIMLDYGVKVNGYCCDMSRTFFKGKPTLQQRKMYNLVKKVQLSSIKRTRSNIPYKDIDISARKSFGKYKKFFKHTLGHGVGKNIHQYPNVSPKSKHIAKEGDIITIEPGLYFKNKFGIRIEDTVLVKKTSCHPLNKCSKELIII